jgi:hypothetical protein
VSDGGCEVGVFCFKYIFTSNCLRAVLLGSETSFFVMLVIFRRNSLHIWLHPITPNPWCGQKLRGPHMGRRPSARSSRLFRPLPPSPQPHMISLTHIRTSPQPYRCHLRSSLSSKAAPTLAVIPLPRGISRWESCPSFAFAPKVNSKKCIKPSITKFSARSVESPNCQGCQVNPPRLYGLNDPAYRQQT